MEIGCLVCPCLSPTPIKKPRQGNRGHWHNKPMIYSAGDLGVQIDLGPDTPGMILQHLDNGYWHDYLIDSEPVINPIDINTLPSGQYRLREE
jgi:hypothetical protein